MILAIADGVTHVLALGADGCSLTELTRCGIVCLFPGLASADRPITCIACIAQNGEPLPIRRTGDGWLVEWEVS